MSKDLWFIAGVTAACAVGAGLLGALLVNRVRRVSLVAALVVTSLTPAAALALALWFNLRVMFLSEHDAQVTRLVLGLSCLPAVVLAVLLGRMVLADLQTVARQARALGGATTSAARADASTPDASTPVASTLVTAMPVMPVTAMPVTAELASLAAELARTQERLEVSHRRERALESSRRQVVAFVSHDLRSPLSGIRAAVDGLRDGVIVDTDGAYEGIDRAVDRLGRMIDDLAELSRPDAEPAPRVTERVALSAVLEDVLAHTAPAAASQEVQLHADVDPGLEVLGVPDELARVLDNLVGNAVRSSGRGGSVRVAAHHADGRVHVAVEDTCGGIPAEQRAHVFDEGFQGGGAHRTQAAVGASGLGLAIVGTVVAAHGGRVGVEPTDAGCVFEVSLPAQGSDEHHDARVSASTAD